MTENDCSYIWAYYCAQSLTEETVDVQNVHVRVTPSENREEQTDTKFGKTVLTPFCNVNVFGTNSKNNSKYFRVRTRREKETNNREMEHDTTLCSVLPRKNISDTFTRLVHIIYVIRLDILKLLGNFAGLAPLEVTGVTAGFILMTKCRFSHFLLYGAS